MRKFLSLIFAAAIVISPANAQYFPGGAFWVAVPTSGGSLTLVNAASSFEDPAVIASNIETLNCGSSCSIGAAAATRRVIFVLCWRVSAGGTSLPVVNINVGGGGAVSMGTSIANGLNGAFGCAAWSKAQATGMTAVFTVDFTAIQPSVMSTYAVYSVTNSTAANDDPHNNLNTNTGPSAAINHANYVVIGAGAAGFTSAVGTPTNLTTDISHDEASCVSGSFNCTDWIASQVTNQSTSKTYALPWVGTSVSAGFMLAFQP